jgi:hypothetical protein
MNNKGQSAKKSGHLVILLSVIGLVAFSSAMKDLSQLHQVALGASSLVASWSHKVDPVEIMPTVLQVETCELNKTLEQSIPSVELPWLGDVAEEKIEIKEIETPQRAERSKRTRVHVVRPGRAPRVDFDPVQLEVRMPSEHDADFVTPSEFPQFSFKTRTRKPNVIRISPRDREILLKTINRSINLRIAS